MIFILENGQSEVHGPIQLIELAEIVQVHSITISPFESNEQLERQVLSTLEMCHACCTSHTPLSESK